MYAGARRDRADVRFDRMDELLDKIERGDVDPAQARVMMDAIRWMAGKENAKHYGDKVIAEHTGSVDINIAATLQQKILEYRKTVDHEPTALPVIDA
jgi:hypothetical protein